MLMVLYRIAKGIYSCGTLVTWMDSEWNARSSIIACRAFTKSRGLTPKGFTCARTMISVRGSRFGLLLRHQLELHQWHSVDPIKSNSACCWSLHSLVGGARTAATSGTNVASIESLKLAWLSAEMKRLSLLFQIPVFLLLSCWGSHNYHAHIRAVHIRVRPGWLAFQACKTKLNENTKSTGSYSYVICPFLSPTVCRTCHCCNSVNVISQVEAGD